MTGMGLAGQRGKQRLPLSNLNSPSGVLCFCEGAAVCGFRGKTSRCLRNHDRPAKKEKGIMTGGQSSLRANRTRSVPFQNNIVQQKSRNRIEDLTKSLARSVILYQLCLN